MPVNRINRKENLIYLGSWLTVLVLYLLDVASENVSASRPMFTWFGITHMLRLFTPLLFLFLLNNYLLIPRLLFRHRTWVYFILVVIISVGVDYWLFLDMRHPHIIEHGAPHSEELLLNRFHPNGPRSILPMPLVNGFVYALFVVGLNLVVKLSARHLVLNMERERLASTNTAGQLAMLKAQINPHFYMNMLNNIHGLIDIDPEAAKELVFDMSQLMQYMLYDSAKPFISLNSEIKFLQDYLRIMRHRYPDNKVEIITDFPGEIEAANIQVPPLLYLAFLENAFKHGVDYRQKSSIEISMHIEADDIIFTCVNSVHPEHKSRKQRGGVGLDNVRTRLNLIYGPSARLSIDSSSQQYTIHLTIPAHDAKNSDN